MQCLLFLENMKYGYNNHCMFLLTYFSPFMGHIILFLYMPGSFLLDARDGEFFFVECWIFLYLYIFQALFWDTVISFKKSFGFFEACC